MKGTKLVLLLLCLEGLYLIEARPQSGVPQIVENVFNPNTGDGSYYFKYVIDDGSEREETGTLQQASEGPVVFVNGRYGYKNSQGTLQVNYDADDNGFRPRVVWNLT